MRNLADRLCKLGQDRGDAASGMLSAKGSHLRSDEALLMSTRSDEVRTRFGSNIGFQGCNSGKKAKSGTGVGGFQAAKLDVFELSALTSKFELPGSKLNLRFKT